MKKTIQTKRNKPSGSNYRVLYAKTGRKRRLHAATATADPGVELESDVPNIGVGRALLVILVLHILAIAAIYIHSTFFGTDNPSANNGQSDPSGASAAAVAPADKVAPEPEKPAATTPAPAPVRTPDSERYIVVTGDTYSRIAQVRNVDEQALRALNSNRPLRAGVVLDLPAELSPRPVTPAPVVAQPAAPVAPVTPAVAEVAPTPAPARQPEATPKATTEHDTSNAPKAIVVKPNLPAAAAPSEVKDSGERYTIKSGDTLWRISTRYKVSREALLKLNGIKDPNKLYAGRTIKIPAK